MIRDRAWLEKSGELPKAGGLLAQDPKWVEAVELVDHEVELLKKAASDGAKLSNNQDRSRGPRKP